MGFNRRTTYCGKNKILSERTGRGLQISLQCNAASEIASKLDLLEDVLAPDWISADKEKRGGRWGGEGRDYSTLDYTSGFGYFHSAGGCYQARREPTGGVREHAGCDTDSFARVTAFASEPRQKRAGQKKTKSWTPGVKSYQRLGTAGAREAGGPSFLNRRCVCVCPSGVPSVQLLPMWPPVFCVFAANAGEEMPDWSVWSLCLPSQAFFLPSDVRGGAHE